MPAHWGTLEENITTTPLKYSNPFQSEVPRFDAKYYGASTCKTEVYDINHGHKTDLATGVEKSARILSSTRGTKDRFKYSPPDNREDIPFTNAPQKKDLVDLVPDAPISYSQMRSDVKRFQPMGREAGMLDVVYDIDTAHKQGLSTAVRPGGKCTQSAMTYSCFKSDSTRFGKGSFLDVGVPAGSEYNTDTAYKKTLVHESNDSPFILSNMSSKTPRFGSDDVGKDAAWNANYDTDTGHKKTLATAIEDTPVVYCNVRTNTKRFPGQRPRNSVEETQYDTDTGDKTCMTTAVARNQIPDPTSAIIKSRTRRFQPPRGSEGIDGGGYHTDTKLTALSTQTVLDSTPLQYANVRTKTDRFGKDFKDKPLDVVYNTDTGHKKCLTTAVEASPMKYANMNSVVPRFKAPKRENKHNNDGGYYRPNARLLERLYEHFRKNGKLKQLQAEYVPPEADS